MIMTGTHTDEMMIKVTLITRTPGFSPTVDSIFLTQDMQVMPSMLTVTVEEALWTKAASKPMSSIMVLRTK